MITVSTKEQSNVLIPAGNVYLPGNMTLPRNCKGVVVFAHGSGSSRHSPRNIAVAEALQQRELGTLLFDLLTPEEDYVYENRYNIHLLTERLLAATEWLQHDSRTADKRIGYFGASTGAAAALDTAATNQDTFAVVSRGGRPDLTDSAALQAVRSPTLLIVGGLDFDTLSLNQHAYDYLEHCQEKELAIVEGASHLFEEPGKLKRVSELAGEWFSRFA